VQVEVSDQGPGIPAEDLPHIFEKFYRVKRRDGIGGIGLGFSISKGIIEAHGGTIAVTNQAAGGTAVTIVLPASVAERSGGTDV
jgi:signal transduction histidine kinase